MAYYTGLHSVNYGLLWSIVAFYFGLLSVNYGLLWSIVACYFELLGVPGKDSGRKNHNLNGIWDQSLKILGTWTLWVIDQPAYQQGTHAGLDGTYCRVQSVHVRKVRLPNTRQDTISQSLDVH